MNIMVLLPFAFSEQDINIINEELKQIFLNYNSNNTNFLFQDKENIVSVNTKKLVEDIPYNEVGTYINHSMVHNRSISIDPSGYYLDISNIYKRSLPLNMLWDFIKTIQQNQKKKIKLFKRTPNPEKAEQNLIEILCEI